MLQSTPNEVKAISKGIKASSILVVLLAVATVVCAGFLLSSVTSAVRATITSQGAFLRADLAHAEKVSLIWRAIADRDPYVERLANNLEVQMGKEFDVLSDRSEQFGLREETATIRALSRSVAAYEGQAIRLISDGEFQAAGNVMSSLEYNKARALARAENPKFLGALRDATTASVLTSSGWLYGCLAFGLVVLLGTVAVSLKALGAVRRQHQRLLGFSADLQQANTSLEARVAARTEELAAQAEALRAAKDIAEASSSEKDRFLGALSHELRTPLNGVIGMLHVVTDELKPDSHAGSHAILALESAEFMQSLVERAFDRVRLESDSLVINENEFNLERFVISTSKWFENKARAKGVAFSATSENVSIRADIVRIRQILSNLIDNALKYTPSGRVHVEAKLQHRAPNETLLVIDVTDTGPGLDEVAARRIFERFYRVDDSITRAADGLGLGLALCKELTDAMNGSLTVQSERGKGSTFALSLPVNVVAKKGFADSSQKKQARRSHSAILRVLVVDDNAMNRRVLQAFLAQLDADVTEAADGEQACAVAEIQPFDIILMDMQMPVLDGLVASEMIRRSVGPNSKTPILAVTADSRKETAERAIASGMNALILKPLSPEAVFTAINAFTNEPPPPIESIDDAKNARLAIS